MLVAANLPFDGWAEALGSERLTRALLDRLTHHVHILEMNGENYTQTEQAGRRIALFGLTSVPRPSSIKADIFPGATTPWWSNMSPPLTRVSLSRLPTRVSLSIRPESHRYRSMRWLTVRISRLSCPRRLQG